MDAEIQRRRTFQVIAQWIAQQAGVTIEFQPNAVPNADPKTKRIILPNNMKIDNLNKVLALVFHEAAHIAHSGPIPIKQICDNQADKDTLNGCEDVRVDKKMIDYLPRMREFYEELVKWEDEQCDPERAKKIPVPIRALLEAMRLCNNLVKKPDPDPKVQAFINKHDLVSQIQSIDYYLDNIEYGDKGMVKDAKKDIKKLSELIFGKQPKGGGGEGQGEGDEEGQGQGNGQPGECSGQESNGQGKGKSPSGTPEGGSGNPTPNGKDSGKGDDQTNQSNQSNQNQKPQKGFGGGGFYGKGDTSKLFEPDPNAHYALDNISLTEQTTQAFNELLTVKSIRVIQDGTKLDTDNLTAFFTGAVDELFKEVKIEKHKKSKILFLLDSSGSMRSSNNMCDDNDKTTTLIAVAHSLTEILKELQEVEGINVDFLVRGFDDTYHQYDQKNWEKEYARCPGGGTNMEMAFVRGMQEILDDKTVDGNKMMILVTDGQVSQTEIMNIKDIVIKNNSDVKTMILGIGLYPEFEKILGGRNIIAKELADGEILQAITEMLD